MAVLFTPIVSITTKNQMPFTWILTIFNVLLHKVNKNTCMMQSPLKNILDFIFIVAVLITTVASLLVLPVIEITERKPLFLIRKSKMIKPEDYESLF